MPELIVLFVILFALFSVPLSTAFFARRMGRRFWLWFLLGCMLPIIAIIVLFFLPDQSKSAQEI